MIVVDTSVWISAVRGIESACTIRLREETGRGNVLVGDIVLLEVLRGARNDRHSAFLEANLRRYPVIHMMDDRLAAAAAANYRLLRAVGITAKSLADLIIATFCIANGHALLHSDRDFLPMAEHLGLKLA